MIAVLQASTSLVGDVNTITVDSINKLKIEKPNEWNSMIAEFKRIASESDDNYEYEVMKEFITNLQDLY
jgi:hypothetical protein